MRRPITVDDLWRFDRVGGLSAAPDGSCVVVSVTTASMQDNRSRSRLWLLPTQGRREPRPLTQCGDKDGQPKWSPRGDLIAFLARRDQQGRRDDTAQLYLIAPDGGEARRAAHFAPGVEAFCWRPDGRGIVFAAWAWPDTLGAAAQARRHRRFATRLESGYATSQAQYRHWDHHHPMDRVLHLFHLELASGRITDLLEGSTLELPRDELQPEAFDLSPDSRRVVFAFDPAPVKVSGNRRAIAEVELATRRVSVIADDGAWDFDLPRHHPDGEQIAALATPVGGKHTEPAKPAVLARTGCWRVLGKDWDHEAGSAPRWAADGRALYLSAESRGRKPLWRVEVQADRFEVASEGGWVNAFDVAGAPGQEVVLTAVDSHRHPVRVFARRGSAAPRRLERFNDALLSRLAFGEVKEVSVIGALGEPVQMWLTFPVGFDPRRRHPLLQVIHGGPYAAAGDSFQYRWNAQLLASRGHVVAQVNYHGSSGFGFAFKDSIIGRLGELELQDIEAGTDWLLRRRWADPRRVFAAGGSYGGFMAAWLNARAPAGRYRALVCHAGVYDRIATFAADSYPQRPKDLGAHYWDDMARVLAQSPHAQAGRMCTPMLVSHGALDYRVPDANGLACYNMLKARGVDARLLWFPDENHWVLKPRNSRQWYGEVFAWLERHAGP
jgi:dipeptidyl aminopeptidase/acylaminoacyl peptidase